MTDEQKIKEIVRQVLALGEGKDGLRVAWPIISGGELTKRVQRLEQDFGNSSGTLDLTIIFNGGPVRARFSASLLE